MNDITYRASGNYIIAESTFDPYCSPRVEIWRQPEIGQKYMVVYYCDYDNTEHGLNYTIEVTADNINEITFHMNDTENDITEYILCT